MWRQFFLDVVICIDCGHGRSGTVVKGYVLVQLLYDVDLSLFFGGVDLVPDLLGRSVCVCGVSGLCVVCVVCVLIHE